MKWLYNNYMNSGTVPVSEGIKMHISPTKLSDVIAILQALDPELPVQCFQVERLQPSLELVRTSDISALCTEITPLRYAVELSVIKVKKFECDLRGAL